MNSFKCDDCGRFIPYSDLDSGAASHRMVLPDTVLTQETWETLCARCKALDGPPSTLAAAVSRIPPSAPARRH